MSARLVIPPRIAAGISRQLILAFWQDLVRLGVVARRGSAHNLHHLIKCETGRDSIEWLDRDAARKVIQAMKGMKIIKKMEGLKALEEVEALKARERAKLINA